MGIYATMQVKGFEEINFLIGAGLKTRSVVSVLECIVGVGNLEDIYNLL